MEALHGLENSARDLTVMSLTSNLVQGGLQEALQPEPGAPGTGSKLRARGLARIEVCDVPVLSPVLSSMMCALLASFRCGEESKTGSSTRNGCGRSRRNMMYSVLVAVTVLSIL
jgi:hypothetical protein